MYLTVIKIITYVFSILTDITGSVNKLHAKYSKNIMTTA